MKPRIRTEARRVPQPVKVRPKKPREQIAYKENGVPLGLPRDRGCVGGNQYYNNKILTAQTPLVNGNRDTILQWIVDIHIVEYYATYLLRRSIDKEDVEDKIQELYLMIAEISQDKWTYLYEQGYPAVSGYVAGLIHRQIVSDNSAMWKKYQRYKDTELTQDELFWDKYYDEH